VKAFIQVIYNKMQNKYTSKDTKFSVNLLDLKPFIAMYIYIYKECVMVGGAIIKHKYEIKCTNRVQTFNKYVYLNEVFSDIHRKKQQQDPLSSQQRLSVVHRLQLINYINTQLPLSV